MDSTSFLLSSSLTNPVKRKRFSYNAMASGNDETQYSAITDTRITNSASIRLECAMLQIVVGPPPAPEEVVVVDASKDLGEDDMEDSRETFYVHEFAICDRSPFFDRAMKPEWADQRPDPRIIELPDDDPAAFSLYLHWLYTKKLPILPDDQASPSYEGFHNLAYAYVLGERLMDVEFKNVIADAYVLYARGTAGRQHYPSNDDVRILYEGTSEGSPIRQLLIDIWACRGKPEWMEKDCDLPKDFMAAVMGALLRTRKEQNESLSRPWKKQHDQYHDH